MTLDEWAKQEKARITVFVRYRKQMGTKVTEQEAEGYWSWSFNQHKKKAERVAMSQEPGCANVGSEIK